MTNEELKHSKRDLEEFLKQMSCSDDFITGALYGFDRGVELEQARKNEWEVIEIRRDMEFNSK